VVRCANCGLVRSEIPTGAAGAPKPRETASADRSGNGHIWQRAVSALERRGAPGLILTIAPAGHAQDGRSGRERAGHQCSIAAVERAELPEATFDSAVVLFQLERARDPVTALERIRAMLAPAGTLAIVTPSLDSWPSRLLGSQWPEWVGDDRFYFDSQTIQSLLLRTGFERIEVTGDRGASTMTVTAARVEQAARPILSIVMPVFNERSTFERTLEAVLAKECPGVDKEIVIVESRSTDGTRELVQRYEGQPGVRVIYEDRPRGKGAAVRTGLKHATGFIVLIQDADDEYDVNDYDALIEPVLSFRHAFVLGSRHTGSWKVRTFADQPGVAAFFNFGHVLFRTALNVIYRQTLDDPFTMYKVFRRDCLHRLHFECNRFDFDFELVIKLIRKGYIPAEIPVNYRSRSFSEGKKVSAFRDPLTWIRALVKYRFVSIYEP
jgi:hypothetical protein